MSRDPGICGNCQEEKVRAKYQQPRISWEDVTASTSGSLGGKLELIKNAAHPYEYDDESHCANINCIDGQGNVFYKIHKVNKGLRHAAQTGDWTKIDNEDLERLEQLSVQANEVVDVADIDWLNNGKRGEWNEIQDEIDELENNRNNAIVRTAEIESQPDATIHGKEKINECDSTLNNLSDLRYSTYVQELIVDHIDTPTDRNNEREVVVDEETVIRENEDDEQQKLEDRVQELEDKLQKERDEKQQLRDELQKERDEKQEQRGEKLDLREENLDLKEELLNLETERESEAEEATPERDGDGKGAASARANGRVYDGKTSSTEGERTETSGESEQYSEWKQRWIGQPEPTRGPDFSNGSNGQSTEKSGPNRADGSDRDRTDDDDTPGGLV